jgi:hypothetical protein
MPSTSTDSTRAANPDLVQRYGLGGGTVLGFISSFYAYEGLNTVLTGASQVLKTRLIGV